ncbi:MAG: glycosyltransferase, partial [Candidatus Nanoarchaeia archaeon]|nr:glycosyltransferase family 2 protein [Candidatus Haiyanarchaeum thermophilum]
RAIDSCLNLKYPKDKLEIIVVNDGSTDRTEEICRKYEAKKLIKLINKPNSGKANSLNLGISLARGELICCLDADSYFDEEALLRMVGYFNDKEVAAVTAALKVSSSNTILEKIQHLEYLFSVYLRKMFSFLDCIYVIPGPGSIYRKEVLQKVGGFDPNNLVEDTDIAFRIQRLGYKIENSVNAVVYTHIPRSFRGLLKQRIRWYTGYLENVLGKHRDLIFFKGSPNLGMFLLPSNFLWLFSLNYLLIFSVYELFGYLYGGFRNLFLIGFDLGILLRSIRFGIGLNFFSSFFLIFLGFSSIVILISLKVGREKVGLKERYSNYIAYIALYFILISFFWLASTVFLIYRKVRGGGGWKGEKVR